VSGAQAPREISPRLPLPYYVAAGDECTLFETAHREQLPVLLKGPTGCGKSRLVEHMAARLGRPLVTVSCHDETSAVDLTGRWLVRGGETIWQDGPITRAVRAGAILYLDEIAEARSDVVVVIHPLADHRRSLYVDRRDELVEAAPGFQLVVSFNPGYQRGSDDLKPSTRQRFVSIAMAPPAPDVECEILQGETGIDRDNARRLVALGARLREADAIGLVEIPSTRLLVNAARLMLAGIPARAACNAGIVEALTDDLDVATGLRDLVALCF